MKRLLPLFAVAFVLPAFGAEPDPNPNRIQTDSIDRPVLEAPRTPPLAEPRSDERAARGASRSDAEPPAGDTKPGGASRVVEEKRRGEDSGSPSVGGSAASTRGKSLSPDN